MTVSKKQLSILAVLAAGILPFAATAASLEEARESMLKSSPFMPYSPPKKTVAAPPPKVEQAGPLSREIDFNGVLHIGEDAYFSVFDKSLNQSLLLALNENGHRFSVVSYDEAGDRSIQVKSGARVEKISLASSDGTPIPTTMISPGAQGRTNAMQNRVPPNANAQPNSNTATAGASSQNRTVPRRRIIPRRRTTTNNNTNSNSTNNSSN
ncbi:MAG: hypothetical protein AAFX93_02115 [Verrucomicrobiota bacterium]